jgi:hypothetical protein
MTNAAVSHRLPTFPAFTVPGRSKYSTPAIDSTPAIAKSTTAAQWRLKGTAYYEYLETTGEETAAGYGFDLQPVALLGPTPYGPAVAG